MSVSKVYPVCRVVQLFTQPATVVAPNFKNKYEGTELQVNCDRHLVGKNPEQIIFFQDYAHSKRTNFSQ